VPIGDGCLLARSRGFAASDWALLGSLSAPPASAPWSRRPARPSPRAPSACSLSALLPFSLSPAHLWWAVVSLIRTRLTYTNSSGTSQISWQESEVAAAQGSKRAEVTLVEGEHPPSTVLLRSDDHAEICEPNIEIFVAALQVSYYAITIRLEMSDSEPTGSKIVDKGEPRATAKTATEEIIDLCGHWSWHHEFARLVPEQCLDRRTEPIAAVSHCNQWGRVHDQGQLPKPSSRSSSLRSAIEPPGPSALPMSAKFRSPCRSGS